MARRRSGMRRRRGGSRWIQGALKKHKKGALHRQLGIPVGQKIPVEVLHRAAKSDNLLLARRARLALTLRGFGRRKRRRSR